MGSQSLKEIISKGTDNLKKGLRTKEAWLWLLFLATGFGSFACTYHGLTVAALVVLPLWAVVYSFMPGHVFSKIITVTLLALVAAGGIVVQSWLLFATLSSMVVALVTLFVFTMAGLRLYVRWVWTS